MKMPVKNKIIYVIIFLFLLAKMLTISGYKIVWWDSAVYTGMAKYIYSLGQSGLWEPSRPIVWPLMLGIFWKFGLDVILIGRILEIIFGSLCILMTYFIGKKIFNENAAILASFFLALSPTFFFFNGVMLTEIVSTFLSLSAIYLFIENKYFASGIFFGIAFMARFLQLFAFFAAVLIILIKFNRKNAQNLKKIALGFIIAITPFLIFNQISYNNAFFPFLQQIFLSKNSGWHNYQPISYYFTKLFKENFVYFLSIIGIFVLFKDKDLDKKIIALAFAMFFVLFNLVKQKEMRFLIVLLPYMYLLVSYTIAMLFKNFKKSTPTKIALGFFIIYFIISGNTIYENYKNEANIPNQYAELQDALIKTGTNSRIWVSNPVISVFSDKKMDKLIYYPVFNKDKETELIKDIKGADFIFLDLCDLGCKPYDTVCENSRKELLEHIKRQLKIAYSKTLNKCDQYIFQK